MKLSLGFSPCPNDTFIFDALVNKKIDTGELDFEVVMEDVETLNQWALKGKLDITKLSFPAFFQSLENYILLNSGSALGKGVGPLLITNQKSKIRKEEVKDHLIVLPGVHTTAHLLLGLAYPEAQQKKYMIFSAIEDALVQGEADLGVIIHENRFTYQQRGLHKVADLGEIWEEKMKIPVPLGGIAVKRSVDRLVSLQVETLIRKSLAFAFAHYPFVADYVRQHSQTMSEDVMRQHINLYVNDYSLDLGENGQEAIKKLYRLYREMNNKRVQDKDSLFL